MEQLYSARNLKFVGPLSFQQGLLIYFSTRSKVASNILCNLSPSRSYRTITNWINEQTQEPLQPPTVDHISFFDNTQIIGKTHQLDQKVRSSVITTLIHINLRNTPIYSKTLTSPLQGGFKISRSP